MDLGESLQRLRKMFEEQLRRPLTSEEIKLLSLTGMLDEDPDAIAPAPPPLPETG